MFNFKPLYLSILAAVISVAAAVPGQQTGPSVTIRNGTVLGQRNNSIETFIGIPYAQPPTAQLRLRPPQALNTSFGTLRLPSVATACPQMKLSSFNLSNYPAKTREFLQLFSANYTGPESEDCLTVSIQRPANTPRNAKLPVLFWIYGGGFEIGSDVQEDGTHLIAQSVNMSTPVVYVAVNYRGNAFGFLPGKQLQKEGSTNLGLRDQRKALEWVAENIAAFGGDPDKVTIWGESAGSTSVFDHLLINNGDHRYNGRPLFRGAIMDSGSILRTLPTNSSKAQATFDAVAAAAGCECDQNVLACLRAAPYATLKQAANAVPDFLSYESVNIFYNPRPDALSKFFSNTAAEALARGAFARVPIIIGDQEDEGTTFALQQTNLTTTSDLVDYYASWFPTTSRQQVAGLVSTYPDDAAAGSPFGTGTANQLYPQYKRNAAIIGDYTFTLAARQVLVGFAHSLPGAWSYLATYLSGFPVLGTFHASDVLYTFGDVGYPGHTQNAYYINFVNSLDPNGKGLAQWPMWDEQNLRTLNISKNTTEILRGDFRWKSYQYLADHPDAFFL